jgi:hypothetical protein
MLTEVERLANALREDPPDGAKTKKATVRVLSASQNATTEDRSEAVRRLSGLILLEDPQRGGVAATVCGALVENGADPSSMEQPLLARLLPALRKMAEEPVPEPVVESAPVVPEVKPVKPLKRAGALRTIGRLLIAGYKLRRAMKKHQREMAALPVTENEAIVKSLQCSTIAMFSASAASRSTQVELRNLSKALSDRVELCGWLDSVFDVLDDEPLLVIEPSTRTGMLARLSGTDVNFTLALLLMHYFPGGSRISAKAATVLTGGPQDSGEWVKGIWNLYNWQALGSNGSLPEGQRDTEHWIWNEGKPADIAVLEGRRVILLGPPAYARTFPAQRTFAAMKPDLRIEKVLTAEEVQSWLEKMVQSRPPSPE